MADCGTEPRLRIDPGRRTEPAVAVRGSGASIADTDPVTLFVHGWFGTGSSVDDAAAFERAFGRRGAVTTVVPVQWPAATPNFWRARRRADAAGNALADWIREFRDRRPDTDLRLVAHSLGARLGLRSLAALDEAIVFDAVALLAPGVNADSTRAGNPVEEALRASADSAHVYYSRRDRILRWLYRALARRRALGFEGPRRDAKSPQHASVTFADVTALVGSHGAYLEPDRNEAWGDRLAADLFG